MRADEFAYFDAPFVALAHRGGALYPPNLGRENTLYAFEQAIKLGYRYLETDVHASRDGVVFAFHDEALDRVTDHRGRIAEHDAATLRTARVAGIDPIPTLDEVLDAFPEARLNIDIKADAAVDPLVRTLAQQQAYDRVCVGSFSGRRIKRFTRQVGRRVATAVSPAGILWSAVVPWLPSIVPPAGVAYQLPIQHAVTRNHAVRTLTPRLLRSAEASGRVVHVWTINDAAVMNELIDAGLHGLVTDRIDVLKDVLLARGLWS